MKTKEMDMRCLGHEEGTPSSGYEYTCDYEYSGDITCEDCVCNGGNCNPDTGKQVSFITKWLQKGRWRTMYCTSCGRLISNNINLIPVEPKGKKNRKCMCEECINKLSVDKRIRLLRRGKGKTLKLHARILWNGFDGDIKLKALANVMAITMMLIILPIVKETEGTKDVFMCLLFIALCVHDLYRIWRKEHGK